MDPKTSPLPYDFHMHTIFSDGDNKVSEMVDACSRQEIKHMAITDHITSEGYFANVFRQNQPVNNLDHYLHEIAVCSQKHRGVMEIYAGGEIATNFTPRSNSSGATQDLLSERLEFFSILLMEGWYISNPYRSALNLRQFVNMYGFKDMIIGIAHPEYGAYTADMLENLIENDIAVELNESKFSINTQNAFLELYNRCNMDIRKDLKLVIGTDAHWSGIAGYHPKIDDFVTQHELEEHVVIPKRAALFEY